MRHVLAILAASVLLAFAAHAQPVATNAADGVDTDATPMYDRATPDLAAPTAMALVDGRNAESLSGEWRYILDPMRAGLRRPSARRDFWMDRTPPKETLIEYEWASSPTLNVPGDWNTQIEPLFWYDSVVWHHRIFEAEHQRGRRVFLHFAAANYWTKVWLNGVLLGEHEGGFTPFAFEATAHIKDGANTLVVAVDAEHGAESVPSFYFDWMNYGGITRDVHVVDTPTTFIRHPHIALSADGATIDVAIALDGPGAANAKVAVEIPALGLKANARTDANGRATLSLAAPSSLVRWRPGAPQLYDVVFSAGRDRVADRVGFRTIETRGADILLNGEPIFLKGVSLHEEPIGPDGGRRIDADAARALLAEAKALGANFVRLAHYPHSELTVRLADELGLLVWSEIPVYWEEIRYTNPGTKALARRMFAEVIDRDYNRASVVIWGVANETPITDDRNAFLKVLIDDVRARDRTRLVSAALNKTSNEGTVFTIDDPLAAELDLLAVNVYEGWYGTRSIDEVPALEWRTPYDKPLLFSEFGADALAGHTGGRLERYTEEHQAAYYAATLQMAERIPFLRGLAPWVLKDFRSPRRWHGRFQNHWNRKGLISETGERKAAFELLRGYYENDAIGR